MRVEEIDRFRGLAIVLMVFFSLTLALSDSLPELIRHNVPGSLHLGDFVLPMFLFASGMSLHLFVQKKGRGKHFALDLMERFGLLAMIWLFLSPFSGGGFLEMDELMLSLILSVPTILLVSWREDALLAAAIIPILAYFALSAYGALPDFTRHYLGGYAAAPFYLPVMLAGALAARHLERVEWLLAPSAAAAVLLSALIGPYKMIASPSFMAVSVFFSLLVFAVLKRAGSLAGALKPLEYLGREPLRYWVLMWVLVLVPIAAYVLASASDFPLHFGWQAAVTISLAAVIGLYAVSLGIDAAVARLRPRPPEHPYPS